MKYSVTVDAAKRTLTAFAPFSKVEDQADGTVYCEGIATAEVVDSHGEVVRHDASVKAFQEWTSAMSKATDGMSMGNIREMHQPVAAGKAVLWRQDDTTKANIIGVVVVDPDACAKVRSRVYTGFSIGGDQVEYGTVKIGQTTVPSIEAYRLSEVSLVDRPACPAALFSLVKRDDTEPSPQSAAPEDSPAEDVPAEDTPAPEEPQTEDEEAEDEAPVDEPAGAPGPGTEAAQREPELEEGDTAVTLHRTDSTQPVGWLVTRKDGRQDMVPWAKGKLVKGAAEAMASADAAIAALKAMLAEVAALPGSPDMWTLGDILQAMQFSISAAYGARNMAEAEAAPAAKADGPDLSGLTATIGKLAENITKLEARLDEQAKAKGAAPEGPTIADVLQKVDSMAAVIGALPAPPRGVARAVAKRLHGSDEQDGPTAPEQPVIPRGVRLARAVDELEAEGLLTEPARTSLRLALTAATIQRGA